MKAARGAGYAWGMAEEAGFAAGWLSARGIDGPASVLACITAPTSLQPVRVEDPWRAADGRPLCPLLTGAALSDFALVQGGPFKTQALIGPVRQPVLLLPFLSLCADALGATLRMDWQGKRFGVGENVHADEGDLAALAAVKVAPVTVSIDGAYEPQVPTVAFSMSSPGVVTALDALAMRTTVPASETSRSSGAGAGTSDND